MKTILSVLILGLLMALCLPAAQHSNSTLPVPDGPSVCGVHPGALSGCAGTSGQDWIICIACILECYTSTEYSTRDDQDQCYMNCMASEGYVDLKTGEPVIQPAHKSEQSWQVERPVPASHLWFELG